MNMSTPVQLYHHHPPTSHRVRIGLPEERILHSLLRYRFATCQQLVRACGYAPSSLTYLQARLKQLTVAGYCWRPYYPRKRPTGSSPALYGLTGKGLSYLRGLGLSVPTRFRRSEEQHSPYLYDHTIAVVDVLIAIDRCCRSVPGLQVQTLLSERELKQRKITVKDRAGKAHAVINDAYLELRVQQTYQMGLALEVDRATQEQKAWRHKVEHLVAYAQGPFQSAFGTTALTFLITTPTEARRDQLRRWTEAALRQLQQEQQADLFRLTSASPIHTAPGAFLLAALWYRPFASRPMPLLTLEEVSR